MQQAGPITDEVLGPLRVGSLPTPWPWPGSACPGCCPWSDWCGGGKVARLPALSGRRGRPLHGPLELTADGGLRLFGQHGPWWPAEDRRPPSAVSSRGPWSGRPRQPAGPVRPARAAASGATGETVEGDAAPALLAGVAAHSMAPLNSPLTAAFGLLLATTAHAVGWPVVAGGSSAITEAMIGELERLGGRVTTGQWVTDLGDLPPSTVVVLDTAPTGLLRLAGSRLPDQYRRSLRRFRYGPRGVQGGLDPVRTGALAGRGPCTAGRDAAPGRHPGRSGAQRGRGQCREACGASVLHRGAARGGRSHPGARRRPHRCRGYCHVPGGSTVDMTARPSKPRSSGSPSASPTWWWPGRSAPRPTRSGPIPTMWGATSVAGLATLRPDRVPTHRPVGIRTGRPWTSVYLCSASTPTCGGGGTRHGRVLRRPQRPP